MHIKQCLLVLGGMLLATSALAEEAVVPRFNIDKIFLEGNTIIPSAEVAAIFKKYTGPQKDFGTLQEAMDVIEAACRKRGYTMVTAILPEQELERGTVVINLLEPVVKEILIDGNRYYSRENILRAMPSLKKGVPPNVARISENLKAANENPGRKISLQFKNEDNDKELIAELKVTDQKPWKVSATADNTGTSATGLYRVGLGLQYSNLFGLDHVISLNYITSPDHLSKVQIFSGSYRIPLYGLGDTLDLFGAYSDVDSGTTQVSNTGVSISGKGIISGVRYNMNLNRFGEYEHKLIGGADYRLYDNTVMILGRDEGKDVVAHPLNLTYGASWNNSFASLDGSLGVLYNIPWGHLGHKSDFYAARDGANPNYFITRYGINSIFRPGADFMLRLGANGQYSPDRLISGEQFGLGGSTSVRGYEEREESWDSGISGVFEAYSPDFGKIIPMPSPGIQLRLVGFYDSGYGYNIRPRAGELNEHSLNGTGAGVRLGVGEYLNFSLDWGHALDNSATTRRGNDRIHFKASIAY